MTEDKSVKEKGLFIREIEALADIGGWELDYANDTLRWTSGTKRIFGVSASEDPSLVEAFEFFHPEDRHQIEQAVQKCRDEGEAYDIELRIVTADGKTRWVRARGEPVEGRSLLRGILQDITHQKRRQQQLSVLNRVLRHNLRNDLTVVQGYAEQLRDHINDLKVPTEAAHRELAELVRELQNTTDATSYELDSLTAIIHAVEDFPEDEAKEYVSTIQRTSEGLVNLGDRANDFTEWIDSNPSLESLAVAPIINDVITEFHAQHADVEFGVDTQDLAVEADSLGFRLLIEEGIRNAIEHNESDDPAVTVTATKRNDRAHIDVIDNGPGIPDQEGSVFQRGEESALTHSSGIGLWMMNWIATAYGGDLSVYPNYPQGSIITITLPLTSERTKTR